MGAATLAATRWIYDFADGASEMRALLGGKGANIAEMTRVLGPDLVPAGFTITTEACVAYMDSDRAFPAGLEPWGGSAWSVLSDDAVKAVLAFRDERPDVWRFFRGVKSADEIFFQTALLNSPLRDQVATETLHYIEWPGGSHPRTFTTADFDRIAASGKLFARKFDVARDAEILDRIDRELLGEG